MTAAASLHIRRSGGSHLCYSTRESPGGTLGAARRSPRPRTSMRTDHCRLLVLGVAFLLAIPARGADGEPLPKGAKARLGPEGLVFRSGGRVTLLPDGKTLLLPDGTNGIRRFDALT